MLFYDISNPIIRHLGLLLYSRWSDLCLTDSFFYYHKSLIRYLKTYLIFTIEECNNYLTHCLSKSRPVTSAGPKFLAGFIHAPETRAC